MYLTRLTLDPSSAQARRDLGDAYEMHRTLVRAFVDNAQDQPARFLWRLEVDSNSWDSPILLVQSEGAANWSVLERLPGYLQRPAESKNLALDRLIQTDRRYRFRLLANPTVSREGKRYGLLKENEQNAWIERQGERHGFAVQSYLVSAKDFLNSRGKGKTAICIQRVRFDGLLEVRQADAFKQALADGIGPAKAFGCGLLSVAPC
jgi:CRISPR system Cascade subunit CasE